MSRIVTVCILTDEAVHAVAFGIRGRGATSEGRGRTECAVPDTLLVEHDTAALTEAIASAVQQAGAGMAVRLVIPAQWCFNHRLTLPAKTTEAALAFEFEQYLPMALEEVTCGFLSLGKNGFLAVAVPTAPMAELLQALSQRGIEVEHLSMDLVSATSLRDSDGVVAICDARWTRVADFRGQNGENIITIAASDLLARALPDTAETETLLLDLRRQDGNVAEAASTNECRILYGDQAILALAQANATNHRSLDLLTGPLAPPGRWEPVRRLAHQCLIGAAAVLLVAVVTMHLRSRAVSHQLAAVQQATADVYRSVFPVDVLPLGMALRLASERLRLEGLTRRTEAGSNEETSYSISAIELLRHVAASLPSDVRIMLTEARLEAGQLTLRGQTAEHRDAERIVEALNGIAGIVCQAPRTTRLNEGGVEFSITANQVKENHEPSQSTS